MRLTGMLDISVRNPVTLDKFTSFEVAILTKNPAFSCESSRTRRRYSEFCWLRKRLKSHHPLNTPPKLPSRKAKLEVSDPQFLVQRMKELEDWLYDVVDTTLYLSDTAVHLFLQTNLSCDQMDQYLIGKLPESVKLLAEKECDMEANSICDSSSLDDQDLSGLVTFAEQEPVCIKSNSSPSRRGDSGLAVSSESDIDSSYESSNYSLTESPNSSIHSFPSVTVLDTDNGKKGKKSAKTIQPMEEQTAGSECHMTSHMVQTSIYCTQGIVITNEVGLVENSLETVDSETQTTDLEQEVNNMASRTANSASVSKSVQQERTGNHHYLNDMAVEVGLRCSINSDINEK